MAPCRSPTLATPVLAAPLATLGVDATTLGVRAGAGTEQTNMLQAAIDQTAAARVPLVIGPGEYRTGPLKLPAGTQLIGVRGATNFVGQWARPCSARGADHITLSGLILDGFARPLPEGGALVHIVQSKNFRMVDCDVRRRAETVLRWKRLKAR